MRLTRWLRVHWDRVTGWIVILLGAFVLYLGWQGLSTTPFPAEQMPYVVSGGIGGGLLVVLGAALLISADLRDEWHKLDRIEQVLRDQDGGAGGPDLVPTTADDIADVTVGQVAADANGSAADATARVGWAAVRP